MMMERLPSYWGSALFCNVCRAILQSLKCFWGQDEDVSSLLESQVFLGEIKTSQAYEWQQKQKQLSVASATTGYK